MRLRRLVLAVLLATPLLGCGDDDAKTSLDPKVDRELAHCMNVIRWVARRMGDLRFLETKDWMRGDTRTISLLYELTYRPGEGRAAQVNRDTILCDYDRSDEALAARGKAAVTAQHIKLRGIPLSDDELWRINILVSLTGGG